jgi:hypothetical protein
VRFYPVSVHHSGHGSDAHLGSTLLGAFGVTGMLAVGIFLWLHFKFEAYPGNDTEHRQAKRFRAARRVDADGARKGEDIAVRVRVVEPPGGTVPGWGPAPATWTKLIASREDRAPFEVERGEILVEDASGSRIAVDSRGLTFLGRATPGVDPSLCWAEGTEYDLPTPLLQVLRDEGFQLHAADGTLVRLLVTTAQIVPGETLWLVGRIRRVGGPPAGAAGSAGYREHHETASFASEGDRLLVRAETEDEAMQLFADLTRSYVGARRRLAALAGLMLLCFVMVGLSCATAGH